MDIDWTSRVSAVRLDTRNVVGGRREIASGDAEIAKLGPRDGRFLYGLMSSGKGDVDRAVASGRQAFEDGRWSGLRAQSRRDTLLKLADLIIDRRESLALIECLDAGKPISEALTIDVGAAAAAIRFNAEMADKLTSTVLGTEQSSLSFELQRPYGVVAGLVGWNFPLVLAAQKIGPALATGNSLVLKPSEVTSLSALYLAELALEAGIPEGVLNVLTGDGSTGALLAHHDDIDLLTFTGSSETGKRLIAASAASNMKRLILECGGKAPNIVFDDCPNLPEVADAIVKRAFWHRGQVCTASSRVLVQEPLKDRLLQLIIERVQSHSVGDPLLPETSFGPVVSRAHAEKVAAYVETGMSEGAALVFQSDQSDPVDGGFYAATSVFDNVRPEHQIAKEEIFGPVLSVITFQDEKEAIQIANATDFGLSAIVWTRDLGRAHRVSFGIHAGWIVVNATARPSGGLAPGMLCVGGHKASGMGEEGGISGLHQYLRKSSVQFFV